MLASTRGTGHYETVKDVLVLGRVKGLGTTGRVTYGVDTWGTGHYPSANGGRLLTPAVCFACTRHSTVVRSLQGMQYAGCAFPELTYGSQYLRIRGLHLCMIYKHSRVYLAGQGQAGKGLYVLIGYCRNAARSVLAA